MGEGSLLVPCLWKADTRVNDTTTRVASRIEDSAACQYEYGDDLIGDMLKAEALKLRQCGPSMFCCPAEAELPEVNDIESLRARVAWRARYQAAADACEQLVASCWMAEGFSSPDVLRQKLEAE